MSRPAPAQLLPSHFVPFPSPWLRGLFLCWLFFIAPILARADVESDAEEAKTQARLEKLRAEIAGLRKNISHDNGRHASLREQLRLAEIAISGVVRHLDALEKRLNTQRRKLKKLNREQAHLRRDLRTQRDRLTRQLRAAYAMGRQEYLKILLNQQEPGALGRTLVYYDYFNRARVERIDSVNKTLDELRQLSERIGAEERKLAVLHEEQSREKRSLEASRAEREKAVKALAKAIQGNQQKLSRFEADARDLETLLQGIREALADIPMETADRRPFRSLRGRLPLPVRGKILQRFGSPRKVGNLRWQGLLIAAPEGSVVKAVSHGRVAFADWLRGFGLMAIIDHGDGYMSLYGHNQSLYVETGDWVEAGQPVAQAGRSGGQEESALYFEIRHQGKPRNPLEWCRLARN